MSKETKSVDKARNLLKKLFRTENADLDFGIYRIMNFKRVEIERFIDKDLIEAAEAEFKGIAKAGAAELEKELERRKNEINDFVPSTIGDDWEVLQNHELPKVKEFLEVLEDYNAAEVSKEQVQDVFNHIYEFFSRYYEDGDFIPRTRYGGRDKYFIPYNGEEVLLYWATKDMYYVKTTEFFNKYSFKTGGYNVTFKLVEAQIEIGDVKSDKKYFILHDEDPVQYDKVLSGVEIKFNYRVLTDEEKNSYGRRSRTKIQDDILNEAFTKISSNLEENFISGIFRPRVAEEKSIMRKHLEAYVERNTKDFFIHKNLKEFLIKELEFYLKNELLDFSLYSNKQDSLNKVMMAKIQAIRGISTKIIEFLSQLEEYQKKLFEKKKFVLRTDYCISLNLVLDKFYELIAQNKDQVKAWKLIYNLNEVTKNTLYDVSEKNTLNIEFLKKYNYMLLDTQYFEDSFKNLILDKLDDIENNINGLIIKSENFTALNLIKNTQQNKIKCIYIDPPYNTGSDDFLYKDKYKDASWATMMFDRIAIGADLLSNDGIFLVSIDDRELNILKNQLDHILYKENFISNFIWSTEGHTDNQFQVKINHEYILCYGKNNAFTEIGYVIDPNTRKESNVWKGYAINSITKNGSKNPPSEVLLPKEFPCLEEELVLAKTEVDDNFLEEVNRQGYITRDITRKYDATYPIRLDDMIIENFKLKNPCRVFSGWANVNKLRNYIENDFQPLIEEDGNIVFYLSNKGVIYYKKERHKVRNILSVLQNMGTTEKMRSELENMGLLYSYPKPKELIKYLLKIGTNKEGIVIDYFAGSGTTAQAIIEMIRDKDFKGKYIMIEQAEHFEKVIKPRILKNTFSKEWKNGIPLTYDGISYVLKYQYIEQYEDTLNNIVFIKPDGSIQSRLDRLPDYFLSYMLDYETKDSPTRISLDQFKTPFNYRFKIINGGEEKEESVDLVETFNYLLGLHINRLRAYKDGERLYRAVYGERGNEQVVVIWRNTIDLDLKRDKEFIEETILVDIEPDLVYINGDSYLKNSKPIEPEFKQLMGA